MPGIFVQTVVFGSIATAIGLATDMKSGLMERFHALPMARSAVLTGRTFADLSRNVFVVILMMVVGFLVGWRIHTNVFGLIAGGLLVLLFGFALSWIFATVGLALGDPETAQAAAFPVLAPLVFASSAFVPVESMPAWLQGWPTTSRCPSPSPSARSRSAVRRRPSSCRPSRGSSASSPSSARSRFASTAARSEAMAEPEYPSKVRPYRAAWRRWLSRHHRRPDAVWLV